MAREVSANRLGDRPDLHSRPTRGRRGVCMISPAKIAAAHGLDIAICKGVNHGALVEGETFATIK